MRLLLLFLLLCPSAHAVERIENIVFEGDLPIPEEQLREALPLKKDQEWKKEQLSLSQGVLLSFLESQGYLDTVVNAKEEKEHEKVSFIFHIFPGPLYHFGSVKIEGLRQVPSFAVYRELRFKPREPFNRSKLLEAQSRIYSLNLFEDLTLRTSTTPAKTVDVLILAKEKPSQWIKGGLGYGSEERQRFSLIYSHENFLQRAYRMELMSTLSAIWLEYKADFTNRYFLGTDTEHHIVSSWRNENRVGYDVERILGNVSFGHALPLRSRGIIRYGLERNNLFNVDPEISQETPNISQSRSVTLALNRDVTDNLFFPSRGSRLSLSLDHFGKFLGGSFNFHRIFWESSFYQRLFSEVISALSIRAGAADPLTPSVDLPIFERFFTGGANSIRGYGERGVGPKDLQGAPFGGEWVAGGSFEIRFPIWKRLSGAVFTDGGQVGYKPYDIDFQRWKTSAGGGLRFRTPVGPFRLDAGYKLNPSLNDQELWRLHLSLGEAF